VFLKGLNISEGFLELESFVLSGFFVTALNEEKMFLSSSLLGHTPCLTRGSNNPPAKQRAFLMR
jgi:hypothetical protein